jgi:putative ABC transport system permease protein
MAGHLRAGLRQFRRRPGFALAVVSTLALAEGANLAVFSVVNAVVIRALPYAEPQRLVWIASVRADNPDAPFTLPEFADYRSRARTLAGIAAYANWSASVAGEGTTERLQGARMSANGFDLLGVTASAGRLLRDSDDLAESAPVVVISDRFRVRRFGRAQDVVGRRLRINGAPFEIVGVMPSDFSLPLRDIDVVTPLVPDRDPLRHLRNSVNFLRFFGRLAEGTTREQAQSELTSICAALRGRFPVEYARKEAVRVVPLADAVVGGARSGMLLLFAASLIVLATALANLLCLVLARANDRRGELAVRSALGATRLQLLAQLAVEALLLATAGTAAGFALAAALTRAAVRWIPASIPRTGEIAMDGTVVLFAIGLAAAAAVLFTAAPFSAAVRKPGSEALRLASRGSSGDRWNARARHALVIAEISAALILVLATGVVLGAVSRLQRVDPGFSPDAVFQARVSIPPTTYRSAADLARFYERLSERLATAPGTASAGLISVAPLSGLIATVPFGIADRPSVSRRDVPSANLRVISPGYLSAAGTRLVAGRPFVEQDTSATASVALVSAALADRFLSDGALGRHLTIDDNSKGPRPVQIVGVVQDVRQSALDGPPALDIYIPLRQVHPDAVGLVRNNHFWVVRTGTDPAAFRETFLAHVRAVDPDVAVSSAGTMRQYIDASLGPRRFNLALLASFSCAALLLAASGLYALVSYAVSQRTREIGVRMAIGAGARDVYALILREAAGLAVAGTALGLSAAVIARPLASQVARDASLDAVTALVSAFGLAAVVIIAAGVPARRAARIEPAAALKAD